MASDARLRANAKWDAANTDKIGLKINRAKGPTKEEIKAAADRAGESLSAYIVAAVRQRMERDQANKITK